MPSMGMDSSGLNSELVAFSSDLQDKESKHQANTSSETKLNRPA
jgi:hypothetical protein